MSLAIQLTPGYLFQDDERLTPAKLRAIAQPTILLIGTLGTFSLTDASVTTAKIAAGALSADAAGRAIMAAGYLLISHFPTGVFTADAPGRAPFAAKVINAALLDETTARYGMEGYAAGTFVTGTYNVNLATAPGALTTGMRVRFLASAANTGATTLNLNSLGAKNIYKYGSHALEANDILTGQIVTVVYDGTNWQMVGGALSADATGQAQVAAGFLTANTGGRAIMADGYITLPKFDSTVPVAGTRLKFNGASTTSKTVSNTVNTVNSQITVTAHGMSTGQCCALRNTGGGLPAASPALAANTPYYARVMDANTLQLYPTLTNEQADTAKITLTGNGTGTSTLDYIVPVSAYNADVIPVSSAGSLSTGQFIVNFQTAFDNAHYLVQLCCKYNGAGIYGMISDGDGGSTGKVRLRFHTDGGGDINPTEAHVTVLPGV
jgi:hypothetical protein